MNDLFDKADEIFIAKACLEPKQKARRQFGVGDLYRILTDPKAELDPQLTQDLFAVPHLRESFRALRRRLAVHDVPAMAAASDGGLNSRIFEGGRLRLVPARSGGFTYAIFELETQQGSLTLMLAHPDGTIVRRSLPQADDLGEVMLVLDPANSEDEELLRLLSDPLCEGGLFESSAD
ncbi:hypothetical protein [Roseibium album]|uniref:hypothetical protein n=1 Tax=Roseibium album TaxID=311410 RepID=UPI00329922F6